MPALTGLTGMGRVPARLDRSSRAAKAGPGMPAFFTSGYGGYRLLLDRAALAPGWVRRVRVRYGGGM